MSSIGFISKVNLQKRYRNKTILTFVSALFVFILLFSLLSTFSNSSVSPFVLGLTSDVEVSTSAGLLAAIAAAPPAGEGVSFVIALKNDIQIVAPATVLSIPAGKDITLISVYGEGVDAEAAGFWRLIGRGGLGTIVVDGVLRLGSSVDVSDGIIVTHASGQSGRGVTINSGGKLVMNSGEISGNFVGDIGGGVHNNGGVFEIAGDNCVIANNRVTGLFGSTFNGGGVYNNGFFTVSGDNCLIVNNNAGSWGGGVYNIGDFVVSGDNCVIANNIISGALGTGYSGGGVYNSDSFTVSGDNCVIASNNGFRSGGGVYNGGDFVVSGVNVVISNNAANYGGGVYNSYGGFVMSGVDCVIFNNTAVEYGGGVYNAYGDFVVSGDGVVISNNTASLWGGGGVYNAYGDFVVSGDGVVISNNTAAEYGGGVYNYFGSFVVSGDGVAISGNTGLWGGGVCNVDGDFVVSGVNVVISNNTATEYGGGVYTYGDSFVVSGVNVVISNNTATEYGGGVYIEGSFEMSGGEVANNIARYGGGVYVDVGSFVMQGGGVVNNFASLSGGGVYSVGSFMLSSGGVVANNTATNAGGGVYSAGGSFVMSDGVIANNTSYLGGGVYIRGGVFKWSDEGGVIANNTAVSGGGVYNGGSFVMSGEGGVIANNTAVSGGGVFVLGGSFVMSGVNSAIANNTAVDGGGVYVYDGRVELLGGKVLGNVASEGNGGGVWVTDTNDKADFEKLFVGVGVAFEKNYADSGLYSLDLSEYGAVYAVQIESNSWTNGLKYGYNNFDISYTYGSSVGCYGVTYDVGAGGEGAPVDVGTYDADEVVTVLFGVPTRTGYVFMGWFYDGEVFFGGDTFVMPAGVVVLVAQWEVDVKYYSVMYAGNGFTGGVVPVDSRSPYASGSIVLVQDQGSMVREGYTFLGWAPSFDVDTAVYVEGSAFSIFKDTTLYAVWTQESTFTVTYKPGAHGSFTDFARESELVYTVVAGGLTPEAPIVVGEVGWQFAGWDPVLSVTVTEDALYVAQWVSANVGVVYDGNGGVGVPVDDGVYGVGDVVTVLSGVPTRAGYTFAGWLYNAVVYRSGDTFTMPATPSVVLVAQWTANTYTVTYAPGTQGTFTSQVYSGLAYGVNTPTFSGTPAGRSGYTFAGWSPTVTSTVTVNITYTAQWSSTGSSGGGSGSGGGSSNKPSPSTPPPTETSPPISPPPTETPPDGGEEPLLTWALANLVFSVGGLVLAILLVIVCVLLHRSWGQTQSGQKGQKLSRGLVFCALLSVVLGVVGVVVFLLTENMSNIRVWFDNWTIVSAVLFAVEIIAITLLLFKYEIILVNKERYVSSK